MIYPDADPLDTDVEDADLFLGLDDEDGDDDGGVSAQAPRASSRPAHSSTARSCAS